MRACCNVTGYFIKMQLHGLCIGMRQSECRGFAKCGADRPEKIGVGIALIGGLAWPCSASCPLPHDTVFLADAGLILEPNFYRCINWHIFQMGFQGVAEVFLKASIVSASCPGWRGRALIWEKPKAFKILPT